MIVILDYGLGNTAAIANMFAHVGAHAKASSNLADIAAAAGLVLPGVGAFDAGMTALEAHGFVAPLNGARKLGVPLLGICLGMQLMSEGSSEGRLPGLGWIRGRCERFGVSGRADRLKVPHMGWNVVQARPSAALFDKAGDEARFYFAHSYHLVCADANDSAATTHYGIDITAAVESANVFGVQFHPEKSHRFGMALFRNFAARCGC